MDPRMIPKGSSQEFNRGDVSGRADNQPGVYYHPQANAFIETSGQKRPDGSMAYHADPGKIQGDAFVQLGYRPASDEELREYRARGEEKAKAQKRAESSTTTVMSSSSKK